MGLQQRTSGWGAAGPRRYKPAWQSHPLQQPPRVPHISKRNGIIGDGRLLFPRPSFVVRCCGVGCSSPAAGDVLVLPPPPPPSCHPLPPARRGLTSSCPGLLNWLRYTPLAPRGNSFNLIREKSLSDPPFANLSISGGGGGRHRPPVTCRRRVAAPQASLTASPRPAARRLNQYATLTKAGETPRAR